MEPQSHHVCVLFCGYNILIVVGFLLTISGLFVRRRKAWLFVALGIALYCVFVGASASVVRAGIMGILLVLGPAVGRRSMALNALAISALVMAAQSPFALWDVGFQLSFAATLGLIVLAAPLTTSYQQWLVRRVPNVALRTVVLFAGGDLMVSIAATLATLPILLYDFHNLSVLSLPVNLLVLPAQPPIMFTGFLVILGGLIHPALGQAFGWLAWPFLVWTTAIVEGVAALPFAAFDTGSIPLWLVAAYYLLLIAATAFIVQSPSRRTQLLAQLTSSFAPPSAASPHGRIPSVAATTFLPGAGPLSSAPTVGVTTPAGTSSDPSFASSAGPLPTAPAFSASTPAGTPGASATTPPASRRALWLIACLALVAALIWVAALSQPDGRLHVSFLDVGQGDATLVQTPSGRLIVIDGGPSPTVLNDAVSRSLPFYQRTLPLVILTRASDEKMAGLVSLLERYRVEQLVLPPGNLPKSATAQRWRQLLVQQFPATPSSRSAAASDPPAADGQADPPPGIISPTLGLRLDVGDGVVLEVVRVGDDPEGSSLRLSYGQISVYLDGDGDQPVTPDATATVLRVGRHGDAKTATPELLDALAPQLAIITLGASNKGGTPSDDTLARLRDSGATVYRTDTNGTIRLNSDGQQVWVETER